MDEFTNDELHRIDLLIGNDYAGATPDDIALLMRWSARNARIESEQSERNAAIRAEAELHMKNADKEHKAALKALNAAYTTAMERFERVSAND